MSLYEDLPEVKLGNENGPDKHDQKRRRIAPDGNEPLASSSIAKIDDQKKPRIEAEEDYLEKILPHLKAEKKFVKAAKLFATLIDNKLDSTNSTIYYNSIEEFVLAKGFAKEKSEVESYELIFEAVNRKLDSFNSNYRLKFRIETWYLLGFLKSQLRVDDQFLFAKLGKYLKSVLENISNDKSILVTESDYNNNSGDDKNKVNGDSYVSSSKNNENIGIDDSSNHVEIELGSNGDIINDPNKSNEKTTTTTTIINSDNIFPIKCLLLSPDQLITERLESILQCLDVASQCYHWKWAQPTIDTLVATASRLRLQFEPEYLREKLDNLTTKVTLQQRKLTSYTGQQTIRLYNSESHPMRDRKNGIFR